MSDEVKVRNVCFISKINLPEYPGPVTQECLRPQVFSDPMVGSGTSVEVAREIGIEAYGLDLHSGFNILEHSILDLSRCATEDEFLRKLRVALGNQRCATASGGFYGVILGDIRKRGRYVSFQAELITRMPAVSSRPSSSRSSTTWKAIVRHTPA